MNIEHLQEAVETVLQHKIDPTVWDRFAKAGDWEHEVVELLAQLFEDAEPGIIDTLAEIDASEDKYPPPSDAEDLAVCELQRMFAELACREHNEIRDSLRVVPGLIDSLSQRHLDYMIYEAEVGMSRTLLKLA